MVVFGVFCCRSPHLRLSMYARGRAGRCALPALKLSTCAHGRVGRFGWYGHFGSLWLLGSRRMVSYLFIFCTFIIFLVDPVNCMYTDTWTEGGEYCFHLHSRPTSSVCVQLRHHLCGCYLCYACVRMSAAVEKKNRYKRKTTAPGRIKLPNRRQSPVCFKGAT